MTAFKRAMDDHIGQQEIEAAVAEKPGVLMFDVADQNSYLHTARTIEAEAGARDMAFTLGGVPVTIREAQSDVTFVYERTGSGQKVRDADGKPVRKAEMVIRAQEAKAADYLVMAAEIGYFTKGSKTAAIPGALIQMIDAIAGNSFKPVRAIASHPVILDGKIYTGLRGYDAETTLYMNTGESQVQEWTDPAAAYQFLRKEWLGDFPFDTELDAVRALCIPASMLTVKTETSIMPMYAVTAPQAGTGKSFMCSVLECAVTGRPGAASLYPEAREEREKTIVATLMQGSSALTFDNIEAGSTVGSSHKEIAALSTAEIYEGRILGGNKKYVGPASCVVILNGNNLGFAGDIASRVLEVRLVDRSGTNLAKRRFRHTDLMKWTQANRDWILGALACILSRPATAPGDGRFPRWSQTVAEPLIRAAGVTDFYEPWIDAAEQDETGRGAESLAKVLAPVHALYKNQYMTASEILATVPPQTLSKIFKRDVSADAFSNYLYNHRDERTPFGVLRVTKANLGERTNKNKRRVFYLQP